MDDVTAGGRVMDSSVALPNSSIAAQASSNSTQSNSIYSHWTLQDPATHVRLLRFLPVDHEVALLSFSTARIALCADLDWNSISYAWGVKSDLKKIPVDGFLVTITHNGWYALTQIDAIFVVQISHQYFCAGAREGDVFMSLSTREEVPDEDCSKILIDAEYVDMWSLLVLRREDKEYAHMIEQAMMYGQAPTPVDLYFEEDDKHAAFNADVSLQLYVNDVLLLFDQYLKLRDADERSKRRRPYGCSERFQERPMTAVTAKGANAARVTIQPRRRVAESETSVLQ